MVVVGNLVDRELMRGLAASFAEHDPVTGVQGYPALEVGQRERRNPITAVGRSEDREQRLILGYRKDLAVAEGPAQRRVIEGDDLDLADVGVGHEQVPRYSRSVLGRK